jgi:hypothetical protein
VILISLFEKNIVFTQKAEAAKIRSRIKWAEEGERSTRYFFELEKKQGENKMWNRIKNTEGKYKTFF